MRVNNEERLLEIRRIPNKNNDPKNILAKETTKLLSPDIIAFLDMTFSIPHNMVAQITRKSPKLGFVHKLEGAIPPKDKTIVPVDIANKASNCFLVIFSFKKIKANMVT